MAVIENGMAPVRSDIFRMGRGALARTIFFRYGKTVMIVMSLLVIAGLVLGIAVDLRLMIISLMVMFLILPGALAMIYYYYGLRKGCCLNVTSHSVECGKDLLSVRIFEGDDEIRREDIPYSSFGRYRVGKDGVTFSMTGDWEGFLWLPLHAYPDEEAFIEAVGLISCKESHPDSLIHF